MAYKTLYRVYRPQRFEDVAGQEHIITTLRHAVEENKIAHAYLFCGPRGTGKTTIAKLLAKAINCTGDIKPCDECENCKEITLGSHPDVIEIDAASNNGVDEVRSLIEKVKYAPTQGKYKVYIIDEVHMMSTGAFNALLKTLEEPPAHVVFILATTEPHKILPTIISRCQRFDFTKLSMLDIVNRMKKVITEEHYQCDDEALEMIAKLADGGMRDALSILEQCLAFNDQHLTIQDVNQIYGIVSLENKIDFIKILLSKDMKKSLSMLEEMKMNGIDIKRLTLDLVDILKDIVIYRNTQDESILFVLSKFYLDMIVPYITCEEALTFIDILMEASEKYSKVINPSIYFELAILKICNQIKDEKVIHVETVAVPKVESPIQEIPKVAEIQASEPIEEPVEEILAEEIIDDSIQEEVIPEPILEQEEIEQEEIPTFEFEQKEEVQSQVDENIQIDPDDIMNILVQAKREILENIQERWPIIKRYLANLNTAKSAGMLCDGAAVAACPGGLIISFEFQPAVNAVNYYKNYKQLSSFLTEILGQEYRFIAVQQDDWLKIRSHFIELKKKGQLPQPHELTLKHIDSHDLDYVDLNEAQEFALKLFGDIVEFKED
ncbi:MAG: DNA polymerase III subunit gamma/tau [Longibaculum muris]|uniref:DNA-directed DNA polymerase n=1 Tax=Longibaculum muris TaxID=1796628 RepID=A0A4R3YRE8_9FIRM|nr:DNA polymerase III subunit gamma/tau [Longibaculum muris]KXU49633.1 DNA polymerase III, subunit gamma and tau [Candidatus Stoquefichus sp. KLE1796]MCR1888993.1 DNA polymerase III subunit gamma/tau [Longibaculum muris]MED9812504.1 DNA polymerase III subunit gamma/tau [Longibaculum muris]TCV94218.1 DNA polymerase-3 subunit gamma/tau [Longibaculum muris]